MNANEFQSQFRELMDRVFTAPDGIPINAVIVELEKSKMRAVTLAVAVEEQQMARQMASRIVPASGPLPPLGTMKPTAA